MTSSMIARNAKRSFAAAMLSALAAACGNDAMAPESAPRGSGAEETAADIQLRAALASSGSGVTSISVTPQDIASGGSAAGRANVAQPGSLKGEKFFSVRLSSSDASVASVPSSATINQLTSSASFTVSAVGSTGGCPTITASVGSLLTQNLSAKSTVVYVSPAPRASGNPLRLSLDDDAMLGVAGASRTGTVSLVLSASQVSGGGASRVVRLSSSNPLVGVPDSITVTASPIEGNIFAGSANFTATLSANVSSYSCTVITATSAGMQPVRALLKILPDFIVGG